MLQCQETNIILNTNLLVLLIILMHSFIFCFGSKKIRLRAIFASLNNLRGKKSSAKINVLDQLRKENDLQLIEPSPTSIGIQAIRNLKSELRLKPLRENNKIIVILDANKLTLQAQHSLLKTLEEPTPNTFIFLETENPNSLLPTILSRCQIKRLATTSINKSVDKSQTLNILTNILNQSAGKRIVASKQFKSKQEAEKYITHTLMKLRNIIKKDHRYLETAQQVEKASIDLKSNVNYKLVLENLFLSLLKAKT